mmetsp:Transcript_13315/g.20565  ORF Transcript_13315/g.20565 Transcript_13315/m.20565 type:complete len:113 (+) Transcript_13315:289-627(+)
MNQAPVAHTGPSAKGAKWKDAQMVLSKVEFASNMERSAALANIRDVKRIQNQKGFAANTDLLARGVSYPSAPMSLFEVEGASLMGHMPWSAPSSIAMNKLSVKGCASVTTRR